MDIELKPKVPVQTIGSYRFISLPPERIIEYLAKDPESTFYVVSRPRSSPVTIVHLYVGPKENIREVDVTGITPLDDRSVEIHFRLDEQKGILHIAPLESDAKPYVRMTFDEKTVDLEELL